MRNHGIRTFVDGQKAVVYDAIVVPQMLESSVPLLEINSKSVSYLLEDSFNFRPGVSYTYTVTLNTSTTAIKVEIGCELEDWNNGGGELGNEGEGSEGDDGELGNDAPAAYTDLSTSGSANCYLIQQAGDYKFRAVIGNTDATVGNVKRVEVLWESFGTDEMPNVGDLIASAAYKNGYICFSTPDNFRNGNAVVAAKNSKGTILWSWHIWCAEEGWQEQVYYNDYGTFMDRNLGATSATPGNVGSLGLLYQQGRKDPFMGSCNIASSVSAASTAEWAYDGSLSEMITEYNPTTFYSTYGGHWHKNKTHYDPCPFGWRVSDRLDVTQDMYNQWDHNANGINLTGKIADYENVWYPSTGFRYAYSGELEYVGELALYWSCNANLYSFTNTSSSDLQYINYFYYMKSNGYSVRCQKE